MVGWDLELICADCGVDLSTRGHGSLAETVALAAYHQASAHTKPRSEPEAAMRDAGLLPDPDRPVEAPE